MQVIGQMRQKLRLNCAPVQIPIGLEHEHKGLVDLLEMKAYDFQGAFGETLVEVQIWQILSRTPSKTDLSRRLINMKTSLTLAF